MYGERLRKMRQAKGLTQMQLSQLAKIDQSDLSKIERGERGLTIKQAGALADVLGTSIDYLVGRVDKM